jgi:hypothetical protein
MGWEFESNYTIEKEQGNTHVPLAKMEVIKDYGDGVKMTADTTSQGTSVIEMVLDPPVQEHQPERMVSALEKLTRIGRALDDIRVKGDNPNGTRKLSKVPGVSGSSKYQVTSTATGFSGNPQITGGVRFDQLYAFLSAATQRRDQADEHGRAKSELSGYFGQDQKDTTSLTGADTEVDRINGSSQLKGLVALLAMYLRYGMAGQGRGMFNYAKLLGDTFMARTDFGAMFRRLPDREYRQFIKEPETFVALVLAAANLTGSDNTKVYERGIRKSYNRTSPDYNVDVSAQIPELGINRRNWLIGVTLGQDRLSSDGLPQLKNELEGLGALGSRTDRVGTEVVPNAKKQPQGGSGIILEMRKLRTGQMYSDFVASAQRIFNYLVALNAETE